MLTDLKPIASTALKQHDPGCRLCGADLRHLLVDLGCTPLANQTVATGQPALSFPLRVLVCDSCLLVQSQDTAPIDLGTDHAASRFGPSPDHERRFASAICQRLGLATGSFVIEVASNNGSLLRHFRDVGVSVLGIEPAVNAAHAAQALGVTTEIGSFNAETAMQIAVRHGRANLVVVRDVLPQVPDLFDFAAGFAGILRPKGAAVFEFPHLLTMVQKVQFDAFRHDRYSYLSLLVLERVLRSVGLRAFDAERLPDRGGSLRVYACHSRGPFAARPALKAVRQAEASAGLDRPDGYAGFAARIDAARQDVLAFVRIRCAAGRKVAAYGATARGNTLLNTCGITAQDILSVADPNPATHGRYLPGSHIPIVSPGALIEDRPDDVIILPWPDAPEIAASLLPLRQKGTQFWTATPAIRRV
ncbi:class I SAM-dependent methyltransferase [Rhodopila sp.]|uniref:class I SAM-dependent methyltransferase n=1 Tax=Rhodopila sp. TaxID=2480087 RepID=UPI003D0AE151